MVGVLQLFACGGAAEREGSLGSGGKLTAIAGAGAGGASAGFATTSAGAQAATGGAIASGGATPSGGTTGSSGANASGGTGAASACPLRIVPGPVSGEVLSGARVTFNGQPLAPTRGTTERQPGEVSATLFNCGGGNHVFRLDFVVSAEADGTEASAYLAVSSFREPVCSVDAGYRNPRGPYSPLAARVNLTLVDVPEGDTPSVHGDVRLTGMDSQGAPIVLELELAMTVVRRGC
jgi:hypothetical protein